ncbi:MAG: phage tail domain-containing protein [Eubacteriaceae bacterium]
MSITKLTLSRGDNSIVLTRGKPYLLQKVIGLSELQADERIYQSANIDGARYIDSILNIREITIDVAVIADRYDMLMPLKEELIKMCNPKAGVMTLTVENGNYIRTIEVVADSVPNLSIKNNAFTSSGTINLIAHKPLLLSEIELGENLNEWIGGWEMGWSFPVSFATRGSNTKNIINSGHVSTPLFITMYGLATNPKIENKTTGEYIKINKAVALGEILTINTEKGNKRVEITKPDGTLESAFNYIDLNSTFFELRVGDNVLEYSCDELSSNDVYISYRYRYLGM